METLLVVLLLYVFLLVEGTLAVWFVFRRS